MALATAGMILRLFAIAHASWLLMMRPSQHGIILSSWVRMNGAEKLTTKTWTGLAKN
jgi:hypothetical protein